MIRFYTTTLTAAFAAYMILIAATAHGIERPAEGCIIFQKDDTYEMHVKNGSVGQTFIPCKAGVLEYLVLHVRSINEESFSAELRIFKGSEELTRQQMILPSVEREGGTTVRLARTPLVHPEDDYRIEITVPRNKSFLVAYTGSDRYPGGSMTLDGLQTAGDLAFEAGVRSYVHDHPAGQAATCNPEQGGHDCDVAPTDVISQTFHLCEDAEVMGIELGYRSASATTGTIRVYKAGAVPRLSVAEFNWHADAAHEGRLLASPVGTSLLRQGRYEFTIATDAVGDFALLAQSGNTYPDGSMIGRFGLTNNDLVFGIIHENARLDEPVDREYQQMNHPDHACIIAQPYWNTNTTISGGVLTFELPVCDDGRLEAVYLAGELHSDGPAGVYRLIDDRGRTVLAGELLPAEPGEDFLTLSFDGAPVLFYFKYRLEIEVNRFAKILLGTSKNPDHATFKSSFNGLPVDGTPAFAMGMQPYDFNFEPASRSSEVGVKVYPNPFASTFTLELTEVNGRQVTATLYSFLGNEVVRFKVDGSKNEEVIRYTADRYLDRGFYTLRVEYDDDVKISTIIKQ